MASAKNKTKIDLEALRNNPDAIYDLLDEVGSDFEMDDDEDFLPEEPSGSVEQNVGNEGESSSTDSSDEEQVHQPKILTFWKKGNFQSKDEPDSLQEVCEVRTPWEYFSRYLGDEFFESGALHTNQYYLRQNGQVLKPAVTPEEIKKFFGIHAVIGCIKYPRIHMYWNNKFKLSMVADSIPRDRFYLLRVNFHVVDLCAVSEEQRKANKLWKVQPMIDLVRNRCRNIKRSVDSFSINKQMIPFLGRCPVRQFVQNKPRPLGLKNFVITTSDGMVLDFEIYQGSTTPFAEKDYGIGPAVVLHLTRTIPENSIIYFDRYFSTIPLFEKLNEKKLEGTGTIMPNRVKGYTFRKDKLIKRGDSEEIVRSDNKICITKWKDNKSVLMISTAFGVNPASTVERWNKFSKQHILVTCPKVVKAYNGKIGGVDLCDQMMECYRTFFRTRKWTFKVILHLFDLAMVNS